LIWTKTGLPSGRLCRGRKAWSCRQAATSSEQWMRFVEPRRPTPTRSATGSSSRPSSTCRRRPRASPRPKPPPITGAPPGRTTHATPTAPPSLASPSGVPCTGRPRCRRRRRPLPRFWRPRQGRVSPQNLPAAPRAAALSASPRRLLAANRLAAGGCDLRRIRRAHRRPLRKDRAPRRVVARGLAGNPRHLARAARPRPAARRFRGGAAALRIGPARHRRADPARGWHRAVPVVALASTPTSPTSLHDQPSGNFAQSALTRYLNLPASDNHCSPSLRKIVRPPPPPYAVA
jgi:hypothetical protein